MIVAGSGPRAVVTTASYEARRFGIGSAMPASRARRLCPHAVVIPPDFTAYREVSRAVMAIVREQVDRVEVVGLDEAYLDLTGLVAPRAAMRRLVADDPRGHRAERLDRHRAQQARREGRLRRREAGRLRRPDARGGLRRFAAALARARARASARGPSSGWSALGITTLGALAAADEDELSCASAGTRAPGCAGGRSSRTAAR